MSNTLSELQFAAQMNFLLTIGYLTEEQAAALFNWFHNGGRVKLPSLTGPEGISSTTMYEVLSTAIHFRRPPGVLGVPEDEPAPPAVSAPPVTGC